MLSENPDSCFSSCIGKRTTASLYAAHRRFGHKACQASKSEALEAANARDRSTGPKMQICGLYKDMHAIFEPGQQTTTCPYCGLGPWALSTKVSPQLNQKPHGPQSCLRKILNFVVGFLRHFCQTSTKHLSVDLLQTFRGIQNLARWWLTFPIQAHRVIPTFISCCLACSRVPPSS